MSCKGVSELDKLLIERITTADQERYAQALELRDLVLRRPLGMSIKQDRLDGEDQAIHLCALYADKMVGVLLLKQVNQDTVQMKQVAVDEALRGQQVGRRLVAYAEQVAIDEGYLHMMLHARQVAIPFYEKLAYETYGEPFTEVGIPHRMMRKQLVHIDTQEGGTNI
ncbi:GNAT family N-acetyltransferase [Paenibacillus hunanensis]|uniref:GNAT family N-acetyltransferase n=1 Tax=Paenibacillus hunanensis TaxID=539262 RepID=UPI0020275BEC|nr:GNAT family N-acetyltransferase [Paenibacillus hunanensis]MCL9659712.1 GNAT family N-acetyltransferase [Paenibacillus hunanensis]